MVKCKCNHAKETGRGPEAPDFTEDENVMYRIMGDGAVLDGIDGVLTLLYLLNHHRQPNPKQLSLMPWPPSPIMQLLQPILWRYCPQVLLEKTKASLHARKLVPSHTLPTQHVIALSKANEPVTALPLDASPNTAATVPERNPAPP